MDREQETNRSLPSLPPRGRFSALYCALWLPAAALLGGLTAWTMVQVQASFAPLVLFPILVGVGLGAMLVGLLRVAQIGHRPTILLGAVLAVAVTVVGGHYLSFRHARQYALRAAEARKQALPPEMAEECPVEVPADLGDYLRRQAARGRPLAGAMVAKGWAAWLSWTADGLLVLAGTLAVVLLAAGQPYCSRCGTWYRTIRAGKVPVPTARRLAEAGGIAMEGEVLAARYRLSGCHGGCGPTRLELSWEDAQRAILVAVAWLDAERRNNVMQWLDQAGSGFEVQGSGPGVQGSGPEVQGSGPEVQGSGPEVQGSGPEVQDSGPEVQGSGPEVQGSGPEVQDSGPEVQGSGPERDVPDSDRSPLPPGEG